VAACFLLFCGLGLVTRVLRGRSFLSAPAVVMAVTALAGTIPVLLLGDGDEARHGYVYLPLVCAVSFSTTDLIIRTLWRRWSHSGSETTSWPRVGEDTLCAG
jgi:hypothetical protein